MGWRGFPLLTEPLRSAPYPIDQESGRLRSIPLGWDGEVASPYPIDQEKSALEFPYIQFRNGFNLLVIINYPLSIIN